MAQITAICYHEHSIWTIDHFIDFVCRLHYSFTLAIHQSTSRKTHTTHTHTHVYSIGTPEIKGLPCEIIAVLARLE